MNKFTNYLKGLNRLSPRVIPFYTRWVAMFYNFSGKSISSRFNVNEKQEFLKHLAGNHEQWQVEQADKALKIFDYFLDMENRSRDRGRETGKWQTVEKDYVKALRLRHLAYATEKTYLKWLKRFRFYLDSKDPAIIDGGDVQNFLTHLALERKVSAATQNQALNALVFLFKHVFERELQPAVDALRASTRRRLPVVLTVNEVQALFDNLNGTHKLMARLVYGCGLRVSECVRLRVKDLDLEQDIVIVRSGKGDKDRITVLPESLKPDLARHLERAKAIYELDRKNDLEGVFLPGALERKYPRAGKEWAWFWVFPSPSISTDPRSGAIRRHHVNQNVIQRAVKRAAKNAGIAKQVSVHTLRHSFATHLLENGYDIRTIQQLLGHKNLQTTMIYTHVARKNILGVRSPLDDVESRG